MVLHPAYWSDTVYQLLYFPDPPESHRQYQEPRQKYHRKYLGENIENIFTLESGLRGHSY